MCIGNRLAGVPQFRSTLSGQFQRVSRIVALAGGYQHVHDEERLRPGSTRKPL
jgi:hypothetical protein